MGEDEPATIPIREPIAWATPRQRGPYLYWRRHDDMWILWYSGGIILGYIRMLSANRFAWKLFEPKREGSKPTLFEAKCEAEQTHKEDYRWIAWENERT